MKGALGLAMRVYFRAIEQVDPPLADVAGRLFAANHWNGIVDPLVILTAAEYDASPIAKSTLWKMPVLRAILSIAEAVPVTRRTDVPNQAWVDNDAVFDKVAAHLARGGNILIFPEGVSHNEPHVLPLKTGAARMLARAQAAGARGLTLQAVALDFDARDTFRSRALVTYGPVHSIDEMTQGPAELVRTITDAVANDLSTLVIQGTSQGELQLLRSAAEILAQEASPTPDAPTLAAQAELARAVITRARDLGAEDPRHVAVVRAVDEYVHARRAVGLTEAQVARDGQGLGAARFLRGLALTALAPFALLGALLYFVPYRLPRLAGRLAHGETDVVSTYKLGLGLVAFPLWTALLLAGGIWIAPDRHGAALHVLLILLTPFAALRWLDRLDDRRGLRLLKTVSTPGLRSLARLRLLRARALDALQSARGAPEQGGGEERDR